MSDAGSTITFGPMESKGNVVYKFGNVDTYIPFLMQKLEDPIPKVIVALLLQTHQKHGKINVTPTS